MRLAVAVGLGFLAAALGTPTGVSGGLLLLPVLLTGYGMSGTVASATNLVFNCVSTPAVLARRSGVDRELVRLLVVPAAPAAVLGALVNVLLLGDSPAFRLLVALLIVTVGIGLVLPPRRRRRSLGLGLRGRRLVVLVGAAIGCPARPSVTSGRAARPAARSAQLSVSCPVSAPGQDNLRTVVPRGDGCRARGGQADLAGRGPAKLGPRPMCAGATVVRTTEPGQKFDLPRACARC